MISGWLVLAAWTVVAVRIAARRYLADDLRGRDADGVRAMASASGASSAPVPRSDPPRRTERPPSASWRAQRRGGAGGGALAGVPGRAVVQVRHGPVVVARGGRAGGPASPSCAATSCRADDMPDGRRRDRGGRCSSRRCSRCHRPAPPRSARARRCTSSSRWSSITLLDTRPGAGRGGRARCCSRRPSRSWCRRGRTRSCIDLPIATASAAVFGIVSLIRRNCDLAQRARSSSAMAVEQERAAVRPRPARPARPQPDRDHAEERAGPAGCWPTDPEPRRTPRSPTSSGCPARPWPTCATRSAATAG